MSMDITSALIDLVLAVTTIVGGALVTLIRRHFSTAQIGLAERIASIAVSATEQMAKAAGWDASAKLKSAMQDARDLGTKHGVRLTDEQWRTLLEQEVQRLRRFQDVVTAPAVPAADPPATPPTAPAS